MKTIGNGFVFALALCAPVLGAEKKVKLENLPAAVQNSVKEQTRNATLVGVTEEVEGGKTMYEVETKVNGKGRDLMLDRNGAVVTVEEEVALDSIPAPARDAIRKKVGGGKLGTVEVLTKGSEVSYEAAYVGKSGKSAEFGVNADGSVHK
jgi:uncharacterized membrane protein YkoI